MMSFAVLLMALIQGLQLPAPTGLVNDFAGVISTQHEERITRLAEHVRTKSRGEIAVVTLADIGDRDAADIALRLGREWKVGKIGAPGDPTRNAGVLILVVPKETNSDGRGRCRIEVGAGSEGFITDGMAGDICRAATPLFIQRDYGGAIEQITYAVSQRFAAEFGFSLDSGFAAPAAPTSARGGDREFPIDAIIFAIVLLIMISNMRRRGRRGRRGGGWLPIPIFIPTGRRGWGGGGGGGGGFGGFGGGGGFGGFGGGGGFSGGGGGSSW